MVRLNIKTGDLIAEQEFRGGNPEKQLQEIVEKHLEQFFHCRFLDRLYNIPGGQIDTLAITEDGTPCVIEYKHKIDDTVINQIIFYYDWLSTKSTKLEFERIVKSNPETKKMNIEWSEIRLICIAKEFSKWDKSLVKHLDTKIECWVYSYHKDELDLNLETALSKSSSSKNNVRNKEITLENHRNKADSEGKIILDELRKRIFTLGENINEGYAPDYIKYYVNTTFLSIHVRKKWLKLQLKVNPKTFDDPKHMSKDISARKWSVNRELTLNSTSEISYVLKLIKQAYKIQ